MALPRFRRLFNSDAAKPQQLRRAFAIGLCGIALGVAAFAFSELLRGDFSYQGQKASALGAQLRVTYAGFIAGLLLRAVAAYAFVGVSCTVVAASVVKLVHSVRPTQRAFYWPSMLGGALLWALVWARAVTLHPALFSPALYDRKGWGAHVQLAVVWVGPHVFSALIVAFVALAILSVVSSCMRRWKLWGLLCCVALTGLPLIAFTAANSPRLPSKQASTPALPNVLFVAADSLRADRLFTYGGPVATPTIDALARRGTRFDRAFVSLPRTFPSWVTLLTGTYPTTHGVQHMFPSHEARQLQVTPLPRALAEAGYSTAVVGDYAADIFGRIDLGYQVVHTPPMNLFQIIGTQALGAHHLLLPFLRNRWGRAWLPHSAGWANDADPFALTSEALHTLDELPAQKPFFMTVFYSVTHFPYAPPYPFYSHFTDPRYRGPDKYAQAHFDNGTPLLKADRDNLNHLYNGAVSAFDEALGLLLSGLRLRGQLDNTIIVLLADHGEDLHDPGVRGGHGDVLQGDASTRIPLIISDPRRPTEHGVVVRPLVRDVDLVATLATRLPGHYTQFFDGVDLSPWIATTATTATTATAATTARRPLQLTTYQETGIWFLAEAAPANRIVYPTVEGLLQVDSERGHEVVIKPEYEALVLAAKHRAIRTDNEKLIVIPHADGHLQRRYFDLTNDPQQQRDVAMTHADRVEALQHQLYEHLRAAKAVSVLGEIVVPKSAFKGMHP